LLTVGVVYCQMHYAVDAVAGLVIGAAMALVVARVSDVER
jgi:membrane-associated phospholipid phosphatase